MYFKEWFEIMGTYGSKVALSFGMGYILMSESQLAKLTFIGPLDTTFL